MASLASFATFRYRRHNRKAVGDPARATRCGGRIGFVSIRTVDAKRLAPLTTGVLTGFARLPGFAFSFFTPNEPLRADERQREATPPNQDA